MTKRRCVDADAAQIHSAVQRISYANGHPATEMAGLSAGSDVVVERMAIHQHYFCRRRLPSSMTVLGAAVWEMGMMVITLWAGGGVIQSILVRNAEHDRRLPDLVSCCTTE